MNRTTPPPIRAGRINRTLLAAALLAAGSLSGCASTPTGPLGQPSHPSDPLESYNRAMTDFNDDLDQALLKPVATLYRDVTPQPLRAGVGNFFGNLSDAWSFVNNALQLRGREALDSLVRFNLNTVFGLGGLLDIASEAGISRHKQDFGLTLGYWGVPTGPYLVLPLLGPSSLRDTAALPADFWGDGLRQVRPIALRNSLAGLRIVDKRADLLRAEAVLDSIAFDSYILTRDVYLSLRTNDDSPLARRRRAQTDDDAGQLPDDY
ncbi:hypothetical protein MASR1M59_29590 [Melaminivora sp.]